MPVPLDGLKILDFTSLLPGPYATLYLADLGAQVVRITWAGRLDLIELIPPMIPGTTISAIAAYLGRGKRCLSLDLKVPAAICVIKRLLSTYDILIESYRPEVMNSLGLGYKDLCQVNPRLIYCSLTGFGQNGPWAQKVGHDINYLALSGIMAHSGRIRRGPSPLGIQLADIAGGSFNAIIGILAAVIARENSGKGQYIDVAMFDGTLALDPITIAGFLVDGHEPSPESQILNGGTIYDYYCTSDDQYLSVGALEPKFLKAFYKALRIEEPDLMNNINNNQAQIDILSKNKVIIKQIIASQPLAYWLEIFKDIEVCVEPVLSLGQAIESDQTKARGMVVEVDSIKGNRVRQLGLPIKFSLTNNAVPSSIAPSNDNEGQLFLAELGFNEEEINQLILSNVLAN